MTSVKIMEAAVNHDLWSVRVGSRLQSYKDVQFDYMI